MILLRLEMNGIIIHSKTWLEYPNPAFFLLQHQMNTKPSLVSYEFYNKINSVLLIFLGY